MQAFNSVEHLSAGGPIPLKGRGGSCIVDLTAAREFRIVREGSGAAYCAAVATLKRYGMVPATAMEEGLSQ